MRRKRWSELTGLQKMLIIISSITQVTLLVAAQIDIHRREDSEINGPKSLWRTFAFVNYVGPILYFAVGRRR